MALQMIAHLLLLAAKLGDVHGQVETCREPSEEGCAMKGHAMLQSRRQVKSHLDLVGDDLGEKGEISDPELQELEKQITQEYWKRLAKREEESIIQVLSEEDELEMERRAKEVQRRNEALSHLASSTTPAAEPAWNDYGWYMSASAKKNIHATEILFLTPHKGSLFASTGQWMSTVRAQAEIWRTDCTVCEWVTDAVLSQFAVRAEVLKSVKWTTDASGMALATPQEKLYSGYYMNQWNYGQTFLTMRNDDAKTWSEALYWYGKWKSNYFSVRALELYQDSVTKTDMLFANTGRDGIVSGKFDPTSKIFAKFERQTETGSVAVRPLGMVAMGGRLFFSAGDKIWRRNDGHQASWSVVVDLHTEVDEAVGGVRGLSAVGNSLLFAWCPNQASKSPIVRIDINGDEVKGHEETRVTTEVAKYLKALHHTSKYQVVGFTLSGYNNFLEVPAKDGSKVTLIGFEAVLAWDTHDENPIAPGTTKIDSNVNKPYGFYDTGGYLIRKDSGNYEMRVPYGPRYRPSDTSPALVAVRCHANSPFDDGTVFMGGYDCNHFDSRDTAWVLQGMPEAVYSRPVPCFASHGCPYQNEPPLQLAYPTPGGGHTPAPTPTGCDLCPGKTTNFNTVVTGSLTCQGIIGIVDAPGSRLTCDTAKAYVAHLCCGGFVRPAECTRNQMHLAPGEQDASTFRCMAGWCIPLSARCDTHFNCGDHSDEMDCPR